MNTNTIVGAIIGLVVIVAGVGFVLNGDSDDSTTENTNNTTAQTNQTSDAVTGALGSLADAILRGPYRVTVSTVQADGRTTDGVIEVDADGNLSTTITDNGQQAGFLYVDGFTYSQNPEDGSWIKFPNLGEEQDLSNVNLGFTEDDLIELNNDATVTDKGTGPCLAGTCRIFEAANTNGDVSTIKVDESNNRISEVEVVSGGDKTTVVYDYDFDVTITAPENATEFVVPDVDLNAIPGFDPSTIPQ